MSGAERTARETARAITRAGSAMLLHGATLEGLRRTLPATAPAATAEELHRSAREALRLAGELDRLGARIAAAARSLEALGKGRRE